MGIAAQPSVILITIDSLRYDYMSLYGYSKETTQSLSNICKTYNCLYTVISANAPYTKASFKSIMTGLFPFTRRGYHSVKGLPSIAKTMSRYGYKTIGVPNNDVLSRIFGYNEGFSIFIDPLDSKVNVNSSTSNILKRVLAPYIHKIWYPVPRHVKALYFSLAAMGKQLGTTIPSHALANFALKLLRRTKEDKFFVWLHLMDTHYPYTFMPELYEELHGEKPNRFRHYMHWTVILDELFYGSGIKAEFLDEIIMFYTAAIRTVDDAISNLIRGLERLNILNNLILVITADHGEEFLEHGAFGHVGKRFMTHIYEELLRVPLMIVDFSDRVLSKDIVKQLNKVEFSHVDLYPTLCGLLGLKPLASVDGTNLACLDDVYASCSDLLKRPRTILAEASLFNAKRGYMPISPNERVVIAVKHGSWKYIKYDIIGEELYNLDTDPHEYFNLVDDVNAEKLDYLRNVALKRLRYVRTVLSMSWKLRSVRMNLLGRRTSR